MRRIPIAAALLALGGAGGASPLPREQVRAELLRADRSFAAATARLGLEGFLSFLADDLVRLSPQGAVRKTKDEIRRALRKDFDTPGFRLRRNPLSAEAAPLPDMGYTYGEWQAAGRRGHYLSVWKRQKDGAWKVVADVGL